MKEYLCNITASAGRTITITGFTEASLSKENVLAIINETTAKVLYSPMKINNISSVTYSNGTMTITLADTVPALAAGAKLLIKVYSDLDPSADATALAQFFGVTLLEGYEFMTDTEVCDELEDIMQLVDPNLTAEQAAAITAQTLNPSES